MAISTLPRLTVPLDSNASASNPGLLMPQTTILLLGNSENFRVLKFQQLNLQNRLWMLLDPTFRSTQMTVDIYNPRVSL